MRDSGQLLQMIHEGMVKAGLDVNAIYMRLGYNSEQTPREARTPHEMQAMFWEVVEVVSGDPDVGLHLCPHLAPFRGEVLEYLMFSSPTFGEGIQRSLKYLRIVSDALNVRLVQDREGTRVMVRGAAASAPQLRHTEICTAHGIVQFARSVTEGQARPLRVRLRVAALGPGSAEAARGTGREAAVRHRTAGPDRADPPDILAAAGTGAVLARRSRCRAEDAGAAVAFRTHARKHQFQQAA
jgi:hypothetical protein